MHEIVAPILYVLQNEIEVWGKIEENNKYKLNTVINEIYLESNVYWIFEQIMRQLEPLYHPQLYDDNKIPFIVHYCSKVQGYLKTIIYYNIYDTIIYYLIL
jgi:hypothetical protein